ncbi:MAG: dihydroorotase [Desulfobacterales bacterium]|nr:dihydroorotase [Desulfobacterales bacterium]
MLTLIKGGRVVDPGNLDGVMDLLVSDGKIIEIRKKGEKKGSSPADGDHAFLNGEKLPIDQVFDATGKIVMPGLMDMHVHLREPGYEYKETIETGCRAAAHGGFASICAMPDTNPVNDNRQVAEFILKKAAALDMVKVYPFAALSRGLNGDILNEYGELKQAGVIALTDNRPIRNSQFMRRALEYAKGFGLLVISHCEDPDLSAGGVMNEGAIATQLGLSGIPNAAECVGVMRDIALCELTDSRLHIAHVSTKESVRAIQAAKGRGVKITAATAPQYYTLSDNAVIGYNTHTKMNPPLRSRDDVQAIAQGLADGTIDVIASDHAPHSSIEKEVEFDLAADGIVGLETSVPLALRLVEQGTLSLAGLVAKMATNPARILGLESGIRIGAPADITVIDLEKKYTVNSNNFQSLGRNTPFENRQMQGRAVLTMVGGKVVYKHLN